MVTHTFLFVQQVWVFHKHLADDFNIVTPNRVDKFASLCQLGPTGSCVTAGEGKLSIGEFGLIRRSGFRLIVGEFFDGRRIAATDSAKQILCLVL